MLSRIWAWRPKNVQFDDVERLNERLAELDYMNWLRLKPDGSIDEERCEVPPYELHKLYDSEEVVQMVAEHLVQGQILVVFTREDFDEWAWLIKPGKVVPVCCAFGFHTPDGKEVEL